MNLSAPKKVVFLVAVVLAVLAVASKFVPIPVISDNMFWVMTAGFIVLAAGNVLKGV